jgi:hypothetical protein
MTNYFIVETSVISYLAAPSSRDPVTVGRQLITERWWSSRRSEYDLLISEAVEAECVRGDPQMVARGRLFLRDTALFPLNERIIATCETADRSGCCSGEGRPDAVHIAAAAVEKCEHLLTWNFRHIANARIRRQVERILAKNGYDGTTICTPEELL